MRDFYLWTGYVGAVVVFAAALKALLDRWLSWQEQRNYTPPELFTEVHISKRGWLVADDPDWPAPSPDETLDVLAEAPRDPFWQRIDDWTSLAEFAGPSHRTVAAIWTELDGVFTAKGLRTT